MSRNVQAILAGFLLIVFVLSALARRFPGADWLSWFRFDRAYDPDRDRKLDTAWMSAPGVTPKRNPFQHILGEARKDFQAFRAAMPELPPEQKERNRRRADVIGGLQFILAGVVLPFGFYIFKLMMFFGSVSRVEQIVIFTLSGGCIIIGIVAIWRGFRRA